MNTNMDQSIGNQKTMPGRAAVDETSIGNRDTTGVTGVRLGHIDQYELLRELGGGGFGVVFLARDTVSGIEVAVKGLPPIVKNNEEELEQIRRNFALVSKLHHPNIAAALVLHPARDVDYASDQIRQALRVVSGDTLMVMTYAPGVTLSKWRKQFPDGRVPIEEALEVCRQIASAMDYAHAEKVVHRDIKPANVMIETRRISSRVSEGWHEANEENGAPQTQFFVKVLDFGLAAEIRSSMNRVSRDMGDTSGTRPYMAPEQWAGLKQDGRTDQYALAVLFYELVSGTVPFASAFETGDSIVMMTAVETRTPDLLPLLSPAQNAALARALSKDPAQRYDSCTAFWGDLSGKGVDFSKFLRIFVKVAAAAVIVALSAVAIFFFSRFWGTIDNTPPPPITPNSSMSDVTIDGYLFFAKQYAQAKDWPRLLEQANRILELAPGNREAKSLKEEAEKNISKGKDMAEYLKLAKKAKADKQWQQLLDYTTKVLVLDSQNIEADKLRQEAVGWIKLDKEIAEHLRLAQQCFAAKQWQQLKEYADKVLKLAPQNLSALKYKRDADDKLAMLSKHLDAAGQYYVARQWQQLFTEANKVLELDPENEEAQKFKQEALVFLDRAEKISQYLIAARKSKAERQWTQLLVDADAVLNLDPSNREAADLKGVAQANLSRAEQISNALNSAKQFKTTKQWTKIAPQVEIVLALDPGNAEAMGLKKDAEATLSDISSKLVAARQSYAAKQWTSLLVQSQAILDIDPENPDAKTFQKEAQDNINMRKVTWVTRVGTKDVNAQFTIDNQLSDITPKGVALETGHDYSADFSYMEGGTKYTARKTINVTPEWPAETNLYVTLIKEPVVVSSPSEEPIKRQDWVSPSTGMKFVWIADKKIWVGKYEVTNGEYRKKDARHNSRSAEGYTLNGDRQPVVGVNFDEAKAYAIWLSEQDGLNASGLKYRLPTMEEFTAYFQCGERKRNFPWGEKWLTSKSAKGQYGNYAERVMDSYVPIDYNDGSIVSCDVEQSWENEWGLLGVGGNVSECCIMDAARDELGGWRGASWKSSIKSDIIFSSCRKGEEASDDRGFRLVLCPKR